jgi:hypothetical protein
MNAITKFSKRFLILIIFLGCIAAAITALIPPGSDNYWSHLLSEKKSLMENSHAPRLILLGGSSTALGIDSNAIRQQTHLNVINEGLHGGMSLKLIFQTVEPYLEPGDLVILMLEYDYYYRGLNGITRSMAGIVEVMPSAISPFDFDQIHQLPEIGVALIQIKLERALDKLIHSQSNSIYSAETIFNQDGDFISHLGRTFDGVIPNHAVIEKNTKITPKMLGEINRFNEFAASKQAKVFLAFPPLRTTNCTATTDERFRLFFTELSSTVSMPVLSTPTQSCYADDLFYDTEYHLNAVGRQLNTERMIELIQTNLK